MNWEIRQGDALDRLREMPDESVQTVATSPPYWGLRDYGDEGQLGLEPTPEQYVANLVAVFREVRRVLRSDGTVWLNLGDSYASNGGTGDTTSGFNERYFGGGHREGKQGQINGQRPMRPRAGLKPKDLVAIPWRVAFALQADGWWLRSDVIWSKPNPMPESVQDRPTRAHEYLFLLTKSARYFYDADAIREADLETDHPRNVLDKPEPSGGLLPEHSGIRLAEGRNGAGRNRRSVWEIATQPYPDAHFATFPPKLVEPCILAGSPPKCCGECGAPWERVTERDRYRRDGREPVNGWGDKATGRQEPHSDSHDGGYVDVRTLGWRSTCDHDDDSGRATVLDPFAGSGTTEVVALRYDRSFVGIELSADYCEMARNRIRDDAPLLNTQLEAA